jgi:hypothetical protein
MTLTGPLTDYIHRRFVVTSRSAYAHTITLTGATWNAAGNTVATFPASAGATLEYVVVSSTEIAVLANVGAVAFS